MKLFTLPNLISLARLPLAAAFVLADSTVARIIIVSAVALSDLADGFFARRVSSHDRRSGQIVDPVSDKLFVLIALVAFLVRRELTFLQLLLLLARDIFTTFAFFILKARKSNVNFKARLSGKAVTVFQFSTVLALLFWHAAVGPLIALTAAGSVVAILDYSRFALRQEKARRSLRA